MAEIEKLNGYTIRDGNAVHTGHTNYSGSGPYVELATLGSGALMHLLAGEGTTAPYVVGVGVDHESTTGVLTSVKESGTGMATTLENDATSAAKGIMLQKFSGGTGFLATLGSQASDNPLIELRNIYGSSCDILTLKTATSRTTIDSNGTIITRRGSSADDVESAPFCIEIEETNSGRGWNKYLFYKVGGSAYYGVRLRAQSLNFYMAVNTFTSTTADAIISGYTSLTFNNIIQLSETNKIGFFNATPVTRRTISDPTSANNIYTALQQLGLFV